MEAAVKRNSNGVMVAVAAGALILGVASGDFFKGLFSPRSAATVGLLSLREVNRLEVLQARFGGLVTTRTCSTIPPDICVPGTYKTSILTAPGDVSYFVDLSRLDEGHFAWDQATSTLTVRVPKPTASKPNIDLRQVRAYTDRDVLTWASMSELGRRENEDRIYNNILDQANDKKVLDRARASASRSVKGLLEFALKESGFADAKVNVTVAQ